MKLLHTADWHLGKMIYGRSLLEDQKHFLYHSFLPLVDSERPDAVLLSGDVFDRAIAPVAAIRLFDDILSEVCKVRGVPMLVSVGNHDGADRFSLGAQLLCDSGFHLSARLALPIEPVMLRCGGVTAHIYMLPYFDPQTAREVTGRDDISGVTDSFRAVLEPVVASLDPTACNILMAHCFVRGSVVSDDAEANYVGTLGELDAGVFDAFDYVALGHLHAPQKAGNRARYAGSPLKYSFDEVNQHKSLTMVEIAENGAVSVTEHPVVPLRDMRVLTGNIDALIAAAQDDAGREDYLYCNLTGAPVYEPMAKLRSCYPNVLGLRNGVETLGDGEGDRAALRQELRRERPDDERLFAEFLSQICGVEAGEPERALFRAMRGGDRS